MQHEVLGSYDRRLQNSHPIEKTATQFLKQRRAQVAPNEHLHNCFPCLQNAFETYNKKSYSYIIWLKSGQNWKQTYLLQAWQPNLLIETFFSLVLYGSFGYFSRLRVSCAFVASRVVALFYKNTKLERLVEELHNRNVAVFVWFS